jgi:hypothetical protein
MNAFSAIEDLIKIFLGKNLTIDRTTVSVASLLESLGALENVNWADVVKAVNKEIGKQTSFRSKIFYVSSASLCRRWQSPKPISKQSCRSCNSSLRAFGQSRSSTSAGPGSLSPGLIIRAINSIPTAHSSARASDPKVGTGFNPMLKQRYESATAVPVRCLSL